MSAPSSPRDLSLLSRLERLDASTLSDADKSLRVLPAAIKPVSARSRLAGRAVTANARDDLLSVLGALQHSGPGDVLVVAAGGSQHAEAEMAAAIDRVPAGPAADGGPAGPGPGTHAQRGADGLDGLGQRPAGLHRPRAALDPGDVALVLTEPAMTNYVHLLLPEPGWHEALRALTRQYGTLLGIDETHTHVVGPGGATGLWHLEPDTVTIGKAVAGGLPMGAYGVTAELGEQLDAARNVATGGTLFGNPLSAAAAKAALTEVLVPGAYAHTTALGRELADGIAAAIGSAGLPWTVIRLGPRSGQWYGPMPRTGAQAHTLTDDLLTRLIRIWLANRGIWEALPGAGPTVSVPATPADVAHYLQAYHDLLAQLR